MIVATARFDALAAALRAKAEALAAARAARRRAGPASWRDARLVWPLFAGER